MGRRTIQFVAISTLLLVGLATEGVLAKKRRRRRPKPAEVGDEDVSVQSSAYDLNDANADHAGEGMRRANADDLEGALESFRSQLKFDQFKANAHNNLGVTLLRMGNARDAETARRFYYQALTNFQNSLQQGNPSAQDNIDAIHQNCKIRYKTNCGEAFASFTGGVGTYASDDDDDDWEEDGDEWGDDGDDWENDGDDGDDWEADGGDDDWEADGGDDDWEADGDAFDEDEM